MPGMQKGETNNVLGLATFKPPTSRYRDILPSQAVVSSLKQLEDICALCKIVVEQIFVRF